MSRIKSHHALTAILALYAVLHHACAPDYAQLIVSTTDGDTYAVNVLQERPNALAIPAHVKATADTIREGGRVVWYRPKSDSATGHNIIPRKVSFLAE